jgi:hypothetical protein
LVAAVSSRHKIQNNNLFDFVNKLYLTESGDETIAYLDKKTMLQSRLMILQITQ